MVRGRGSRSKTSSAAMILPALTAATSAASSTSGPREVLIRIAPGFMAAMSSGPMRPRVRGESTMWMETTSAPLMSSGLVARRAPASSAFSRVRFGTPGDDLHVERERIAGEARAEAPKTHDAQRFAREAHAHRQAALEAA